MAPPQGTGTGFYAERMDTEINEAVAAGDYTEWWYGISSGNIMGL